MPRKLRMQYPGAIYHVVHRGDHREDIFKDDLERERFLATLEEACQKSEEFRQELLAAAAERVGASRDGADRLETGEEKAGRIVREELRRRGWKEEDLPGRRKGDKVKVPLAAVAAGNDDEPEVDRAAAAHGQLDLCFQLVA